MASLPEILSRAQRTAELCARGAPGSAHSIADGSIHSWVAQSRATAIMQQRGRLLLPRQPHSLGSEAGQLLGLAGAGRRGSMEGSPLKAAAQAAESGDGRHGVPHQRLTARRSLAEVRAAIGIEAVLESDKDEYVSHTLAHAHPLPNLAASCLIATSDTPVYLDALHSGPAYG